MSKYAWYSPPISPCPVICPASLMSAASNNSQPESGSISVLRSTMPLPLVYRNAWVSSEVISTSDAPTT